MTNKKCISLFFLLLCSYSSCGGGGGGNSDSTPNPTKAITPPGVLVSFTQQGSQASMAVSGGPYTVTKVESDERISIDNNLPRMPASLTVEIDKPFAIYYIGPYYIEFIRQSEEYLMKEYGFHKPGGYFVLQRTNLTLHNNGVRNEPPGMRVIASHLPFEPSDVMTDIATTMRLIWSEPLSLGATNDAATGLLNPVVRLEKLRKGEWYGMCGTIANIFVDIMVSMGYRARNVALLQMDPFIGDLIGCSHSVSEVWVNGKWILCDPWFGTVYAKGEKYLSAEEIKENRMEVTALEFVKPHSPVNLDLEWFLSQYFGTIVYYGG